MSRGNNAAAVSSYDQKHPDFYRYPGKGSTFKYQIVTNNGGKTLIMTNLSTGNQIYYSNVNAILSAKEANSKQSFSAFANPVKENLSIENIDNNLQFKALICLTKSI